jgi:hypothetical protein
MGKVRFFVIIIVTLLVYACKHKTDGPPGCVAGPGGNVMIIVYANHEGIPLPNYFSHPDTAFIKFGTTIAPGLNPAIYDTFYVGEPGEDHIHCMGLKCGDYFIFRTAWDSIANVSRYGGYGISIADTSGERVINVPVN